MLVNDGLGDVGLRGDLLDAGAFETLFGEQFPTDLKKLLAFSTVESALKDWVASLPGRGVRFEPELYVTGDPPEG